LQYSLSDSFQTFPLLDYHLHDALERKGQQYFEARAVLMAQSGKGLTETYNAFCSPAERSRDIVRLRDLHDDMDRAVLDAYGWSDLNPACEFFAEFQDEEGEETESGRTRPKKFRYRWPDEVHDEILARLLELNRARAEDESQSVPATSLAKTVGKRGRKSTKTAPVTSPNLFEVKEPAE
jgi:hypothetical protein